MPRINQEEYEVLKGLDDKWKWIARDKDGVLGVYDAKVVKTKFHNFWIMAIKKKIDSSLFSFIQWEDAEPHNIQELIEEYEENLANEIINRQFESLFGESEETEVKRDKQWAIKEAKETIRGFFDRSTKDVAKHYEDELIALIAEIIDQLDEPELLTQQRKDLDYQISLKVGQARQEGYMKGKESWIRDVLRSGGFKRGSTDFKVIEKPTIPQFVADWIEKCKDNKYNIFGVLAKAHEGHAGSEVHKYIFETGGEGMLYTTLAYITDEYEVEEEQKYVVLDKSTMQMILHKVNDTINPTVTDFEYYTKTKNKCYEFTEGEIKDYNKRYWPFAVKVEEMEE